VIQKKTKCTWPDAESNPSSEEDKAGVTYEFSESR